MGSRLPYKGFTTPLRSQFCPVYPTEGNISWQVYFPAELSNLDYAHRALILAAVPLQKVDHREQLLHRNVQRFRGGLVFKAHRLCVTLNSRLDSNNAHTVR